MAKPILMPQVGQDLTEGKLIELKVSVGDAVTKGDIVAVVESEKASFEVEAFEAGTVTEILYGEGDTRKVLEPLMFVGAPGEDAGHQAKSVETCGGSSNAEPATIAAVKSSEAANNAATGKPGRSSPLARRIAKQNGIDIGALTGTGPKGSVVKRDVMAAIESRGTIEAPKQTRAPAPLPELRVEREDREVPFNRMRQVIADRLTLSKQTVPHFYLRAEADVSELQVRRRAFIDLHDTQVSFNDLLIRVAALSLMEFPQLNAHVRQDRVVLKAAINIGVAVSVENGLMVPVIENADRMGVLEVSQTVRDFAAAARRGVSKSVAPGTFSISNLGMYGVEVVPIINPPEAAILGVGPIRDEVRPHRGGIHVRKIMTLALAADHRAVDGALAARFLKSFVETLEGFQFVDAA